MALQLKFSYPELEAFTKDHSDGSVTVMWKSGNLDVMKLLSCMAHPTFTLKPTEGI